MTRYHQLVRAGCLGATLVIGGCAGSSHAPAASSPGSETRAVPGNAAPRPVPVAAPAPGSSRTTIERSALRERAIALLQNASADSWALARANALEGLQKAPTRVEPIARAALVDENLGVRFVAAMTIGELHLVSSVAQVRPLLDDPDLSVQIAAIYALAANGVDVDRNPLARTLMSGPMRARSQAAFILGELGDPSAIPLLRDAARRLNGPNAQAFSRAQRRILQLQIAEALAHLGETDVLHTLRAALYPASEDEFEATALAIQILGRLKDKDSAAQLIQLVTYATPETARDTDPMKRQYVYPPEVRLAAATSLAKMGYPDGAYVGSQYQDSQDEALRAQVAFLYGAIGGPGELGQLQRMMEDDSSILVRIASAAAILDALSG